MFFLSRSDVVFGVLGVIERTNEDGPCGLGMFESRFFGQFSVTKVKIKDSQTLNLSRMIP